MTQETIKFLLVDDIEENLIALEALLRRDGLEVLKARSGAEALELLLAHDVALAFLDVQMPEMNGFELAELMRGSTRSGPSRATRPAPSTSCSSPSIRTSCAARRTCSSSWPGRRSSWPTIYA
jgi:CheY-like chemotaxis protein